jgi:Holliday junction resolvasome RuvABC endonuclease subunit
MSVVQFKKVKAGRVMGIDCSTKSLAFCIFYNRRPVKWGKILFEGETVFDRLKDASQKVQAMMHEFDVDFIAMEGAILANNKNVRVTIDLSLVYGAVLAQLLYGRAKVIHVSPLEWQNAIGNKVFSRAETAQMKLDFPGKSASWYTGKKRSIRKQRTMDFINGKWPVMNITDDDVGDSCAIAYYAYNSLTRRA